MKLYFKQRIFSWFDSYDIYNVNGEVVFSVEGQLSWGHKLHILNAGGMHIATVKEVVLTWLPKFEFYIEEKYIGTLYKKFSLFSPQFEVDFNSWSISGNFLEWDYQILGPAGEEIAVIQKELFHWTDTYTIEVADEENALCALMVVLAIDAEKCSRNG